MAGHQKSAAGILTLCCAKVIIILQHIGKVRGHEGTPDISPSFGGFFFGAIHRRFIVLDPQGGSGPKGPILGGIVEVVCPVIVIAVYTVRPRNGASPAWTITWPSVPIVVMPWPGKMTTSLRRILRDRQAKKKSVPTTRLPSLNDGGANRSAGGRVQGLASGTGRKPGGCRRLRGFLLLFSDFGVYCVAWEMNSHSFYHVIACQIRRHEGSGHEERPFHGFFLGERWILPEVC